MNTISCTKLLFFFLFVLSFNACKLSKIKKQTKMVENYGTVTGTVVKPANAEGNIVLQFYKVLDNAVTLSSQRIIPEHGSFTITTMPDTYYLMAFIDKNKDSEYQKQELARVYGTPKRVTVVKEQITSIEPIIISDTLKLKSSNIKLNKKFPIWNNIGAITDLEDPRFMEDHYRVGMWRPIDFLNEAEGGLFLLGEYDPNKLPILFIHGSTGGPLHWEAIIEGIDSTRYQPILLYYPSGMRLNIISGFLCEAVNRLRTKHTFNEFGIVSHSMGGLVARSFVKKYIEFGPTYLEQIKFYATISTPNMGLKSAASGVKNSPIVVASWQDITPESYFVQNLQKWEWPPEIPYHLIAAFYNGKSNDGVVELSSQVPWQQQTEASRMYLINASHATILRHPQLVNLINDIPQHHTTR